MPGNGAVRAVGALRGETSSLVNFLNLETNFTICSVSRYSGISNNANRRRILTSPTSTHVFHGQKSGTSDGRAFYTGDFVRDHSDWFPPGDHSTNPWLVMCGATHQDRPLLANGIDVSSGSWVKGAITSGSYPSDDLTINGCTTGCGETEPYEKSDFEVAEVMVWKEVASPAEIIAASKYLMQSVLGVAPFSVCESTPGCHGGYSTWPGKHNVKWSPEASAWLDTGAASNVQGSLSKCQDYYPGATSAVSGYKAPDFMAEGAAWGTSGWGFCSVSECEYAGLNRAATMCLGPPLPPAPPLTPPPPPPSPSPPPPSPSPPPPSPSPPPPAYCNTDV